jgi:hypothetical protein
MLMQEIWIGDLRLASFLFGGYPVRIVIKYAMALLLLFDTPPPPTNICGATF